jgi:integrase
MRRIRAEKRLKAKDVDRLPPGIHEDGGGLRLLVEPSGTRRWVLRFTLASKRRHRGLGPFPLVGLELAREKAADIRRAAREGRDLNQERRQEQARKTTLREAFETFFELKRQELRNAHYLNQWPSSMKAYVFPKLGSRPVSEIANSEIISVLQPIWFDKPETAKRVLLRLEAVFKSAILRGQREKASPCVGVAQELGVRHRRVVHYRSLPYTDVPAFITALRGGRSRPITKLALEWLILTATRSGETRGAMWAEIDEAKAQWVIPKERMKAGAEQIVPLSARCLEILAEARALNPKSELIFPSAMAGRPLSDMTLTKVLRDMGIADRATAHGFRSSFRDWASEVDKAREVVAEAALAHTVRDKTEAAYRRAAYLDERVGLMQRWAAYCS